MIGFLLASVLAVGELNAPIPTLPKRVDADSVTVVLKESFPQDHIAAVVRRLPGKNGGDVIALRKSVASPELLAMAMAALTKARARQGSRADKKSMLIIPIALKSPVLTTDARTRMAEILARLLAAPLRAVPAVGYVPAIEVALAAP
jgi:hypothetical protein